MESKLQKEDSEGRNGENVVGLEDKEFLQRGVVEQVNKKARRR